MFVLQEAEPACAALEPPSDCTSRCQDITLSMEAYLELHRLLAKGTATLQPISPLERNFYKVNDIKQVSAVPVLRI